MNLGLGLCDFLWIELNQEKLDIYWESKGKEGEWIRRAMWSSLFTIEMVLSFQSIAPLPSYSPSTDGVRRVRSSPGVIGGKKGASLHHSTFVAASSLLAIGSSGSGSGYTPIYRLREEEGMRVIRGC